MKKIIALLLCVSCNLVLKAQDTIPRGVYFSLKDMLLLTPNIPNDSLILIKRTNGDIKMSGGNDYKFELISKSNKTLNSSFLKSKVYAVSYGDSLFINGAKLKVQQWYVYAHRYSNYLVFRGGISADRQNEEILPAAAAFGGIGGAIAGAKTAMLRYLYVMDLRTEKIKFLDAKFVEELIAANESLKTKFNSETDKESEAILMRYFIEYQKK